MPQPKDPTVSDSPLSSDIAAMIKTIEGLERAPGLDASPVRFVVATDWSDAAAPLALLKAFRVILRPGIGAELVFAVPHDPTEADAACINVLVEGAGADGDVRDLDVASFEQVVGHPYDTALVPDGDASRLLTQVAGMIVRMHDVARRLEAAELGSASLQDSVFNAGDAAALQDRLAAFVPGA